METILLILIGVLLFALIIFSHELGHFLTAKWSGVRVNEFALGMGPRLLHFRRGETEYSLRLLPIGGYCAMEGEDEESSDPRAFNNGSVWKRILIVAAGAIMNVLLGIFLMGCLLATQDRFATTTVSKFDEAGSMLEQAGAQVGDVIVNINGYEVYTDKDLSFALAMADPTQTVVTVQRGEERITLPVIDYTKCKKCQMCAKACPRHIIEPWNTPEKVKELAEIKAKQAAAKKAAAEKAAAAKKAAEEAAKAEEK